VRVIDALRLDQPKTKRMQEILAALGIKGSVLIVGRGEDRNLELSARNIPYTRVMTVAGLNVYDVLRHEILLIQRDALPVIEERLSR